MPTIYSGEARRRWHWTTALQLVTIAAIVGHHFLAH